jgi:hypothetical protein
MKSYTIGEKKFTQDELVLSQEEALADLVGPLLAGEESLTAENLVKRLLQEKALRKALAVILVPEGESVATRDLDATEKHLGDTMTLSLQAEVVKDFFGCNSKAAGAWNGLAEHLPKARPAAGEKRKS